MAPPPRHRQLDFGLPFDLDQEYVFCNRIDDKLQGQGFVYRLRCLADFAGGGEPIEQMP
jgi:hypothetical protein